MSVFSQQLASLSAFPVFQGLVANEIAQVTKIVRLISVSSQACASLDIASRVARQLLVFGHEYGKGTPNGGILISLRFTQSDLADMIGASRMRVNRVLCGYKAQRVLSCCPDGRIILHQPEVLAQQCQTDIPFNNALPNACKV
jgi:CRP/FNR family cyclic AMP-dependent transcriptional regulator